MIFCGFFCAIYLTSGDKENSADDYEEGSAEAACERHLGMRGL